MRPESGTQIRSGDEKNLEIYLPWELAEQQTRSCFAAANVQPLYSGVTATGRPERRRCEPCFAAAPR